MHHDIMTTSTSRRKMREVFCCAEQQIIVGRTSADAFSLTPALLLLRSRSGTQVFFSPRARLFFFFFNLNDKSAQQPLIRCTAVFFLLPTESQNFLLLPTVYHQFRRHCPNSVTRASAGQSRRRWDRAPKASRCP